MNQRQLMFSTDVNHVDDLVPFIKLQQNTIARMRNRPRFSRAFHGKVTGGPPSISKEIASSEA
ncbi:MAG: hypothetical protein MPW14_17455 [Candidatus Manganitrophus sp.]|nr:hypothetical protein [Candidatus Manganitrophus sp.]WDT78935.1 MAG: hypothetical protein MPW14_17455 [Candidatus Manganitrophus sp.]